MIEVRLTFGQVMLGSVDEYLVKAGVPPLAIRDGLVKHWWDDCGNVMVYQYIPRAEYELNPSGKQE